MRGVVIPDPRGGHVWIYGIDAGGDPVRLLVDGDGHLQVDVLSGALDVGARPGQIQQAAYNGVVGETTWQTLTTITSMARVLSLDLTSDHVETRLRLTGVAALAIGPSAVVPSVVARVELVALQGSGGESSLFKIGVYDTGNDYYSMFLKREMVTAVSLEIEYRAGSAAATVGVGVTWVPLT